MPGVALAVFAGVGFGLFQATNSRASRHADGYVATFRVLTISVVVLTTVTVAAGDSAALLTAPPAAYGWFAAAGAVHFFFGWTLLTLSQHRLGASRTGVLTGTTPLFGTFIAYLVLDETLRPVAFAGVAMVVAGTVWLTRARTGGADEASPLSLSGFGLALATALCWGTSPVFIRWGLTELGAPLAGVTIGMVAATVAYAMALAVRRARSTVPLRGPNPSWMTVAGCFVALAIAAQWLALGRAPVAVVLALSQLAVPVVVLVAPVVAGGAPERLGRSGLAAAAVLVVGSVVIILSRPAV